MTEVANGLEVLQTYAGARLVLVEACEGRLERAEQLELVSDGTACASAVEKVRRLAVDRIESEPAVVGPEWHELEGVDWPILLVPILDPLGVCLGVLAVAGAEQEPASGVVRLAEVCANTVAQRTRATRLVRQRRLDELVTNVAIHLMSLAQEDMDRGIAWTLRELGTFFGVDTAFLRSNDHENGLSILVDEWPRRENVPDPDPLGVVPFSADPVFGATQYLRDPHVERPNPDNTDYQERVKDGAGVPEVAMAMVPLVKDGETKGVLGFINFGDREWYAEEINALQAIASLILHLQIRVEAERQLHYGAFHDSLTDLTNRRGLLEELERRLSDSDAGTTAVIFMDIDHFKTLNDVLGHTAGDQLLVATADRLRSVVAEGDLAARIGGDEFVVVLGGDIGPNEAYTAAQEILSIVSQPISCRGYNVGRTTSLGIALANPGALSAEKLVGHADAALYAAKANGRNNVVIFNDDLQADLDSRFDTELLLRRSIDHGDLVLHFQPEVDMRTGRTLAVEALVRWNHPTRGLLSAAEFITVAEETGLINDLGTWVVRDGCRQLSEWLEQRPDLDIELRLNISPAQLMNRDLVGLVADTLATYRVPGNRICVEVTEHAVMQELDRGLAALFDLRSLGVRIAIDDFGTGYSSISQLKNLPVDVLKIDRGFVSNLDTDPSDQAIVESIIQLARAFGLQVVAEGVETPAHVAELLKRGCHRAQGWLYSKAIPADEVLDFATDPQVAELLSVHSQLVSPADLDRAAIGVRSPGSASRAGR